MSYLNFESSLATSTALVTLVSSVLYAALRLPSPPKDHHEHSLATLDKNSRHWAVYPEDFYPGGAYVDLPAGRTRYWLFGPEQGKRVRPEFH